MGLQRFVKVTHAFKYRPMGYQVRGGRHAFVFYQVLLPVQGVHPGFEYLVDIQFSVLWRNIIYATAGDGRGAIHQESDTFLDPGGRGHAIGIRERDQLTRRMTQAAISSPVRSRAALAEPKDARKIEVRFLRRHSRTVVYGDYLHELSRVRLFFESSQTLP